MPNDPDMLNLADAIAADVRSFVERRLAELVKSWEDKLTVTHGIAVDAHKRATEIPPVKDGIDGKNGVDATVDYCLINTEVLRMVDAAVGHIKTIKGDDGEKGKDGSDGKNADPEAVAAIVIPALSKEIEETLSKIPKPINGIDGQDGQDGIDGKAGDPGRDAAQIDILTNFDDTRLYRRGTWAQFAGSLWRAARNTDAAAGAKSFHAAGWECMVPGIGEITGQIDADARTLRLSIETGGERRELSFPVPMMLFRGAHELGKEYTAGDVVASDGSGWVAECATTGVPGASKDWKLIAKRGRDFRPIDRDAPRNDEPIKLR